MEETDAETSPERTPCRRHPPLPYWIATGVFIAYACSAVMAIGGLNIRNLNVTYITSVFIPVR
jgi:hypothetical protein